MEIKQQGLLRDMQYFLMATSLSVGIVFILLMMTVN